MVFFATRDDVDQNKIGDKTTQNVSTSFTYGAFNQANIPSVCLPNCF
jgi:hypothetical protein